MTTEPRQPTLLDHTGEKNFPDLLAAAHEKVLRRVLTSSVIVCGAGLILSLVQQHFARSVIYALAGILFYLLSLQTQWPIQKRGGVVLAVLGSAAATALLVWGSQGPGTIFLVALAPLAVLFFGDRAALPAIAGTAAAWLGTGAVFVFSGINASPVDVHSFPEWVTSGVNLLLVILILVQSQRRFEDMQNLILAVTLQKSDLLAARAALLHQTERLDYERYLLHTLLHTVSDRIFFKDLSGRYTRASQALAEQFKVDPQEVIGRTDFDFYTSEYAAEVQARERAMLSSGQPELDRIEREAWRDGRPESWVITSRLPLKGPDDNIVGLLGTSRDITDIIKAKEADQRHAQLLLTVAEVGRAVTSSLELQALLHILGELVQSSFGYYGVNVWLITEGSSILRLEAGHSPEGEELGLANIQLELGSTNPIVQVCETGAHYLENQFLPSDDFPLLRYFPDSRAHIILPLRIAEKVIGALEILSQEAGAFGSEELLLLRSLADQLTVAIRNASLYQSERSRRRLAETLYEVGQALSSTINLNEVLELILRSLSEIVPSDRFALFLVESQATGANEEDRDILRMVASRGFPGELSNLSISVQITTNDVFRDICRLRQPLAIPDVQVRPDWQNISGLAQTRSWLGVPLMRTDLVIGMLSLARSELNPYTLSETTLAATFAGQASLALKNARLYDSLKRFNQQLEEMVQGRTEELRAAYAQLERLDKTKSNFIKIVSHELRTPITVVQGYSQILLTDHLVIENAHLKQIADGIQAGTGRMHEIVNSMLDIAKIDSAALELSPEPVSLAIILRDTERRFVQALKERRINLRVANLTNLPPIEADVSALYKVVSELIGNAIKYTPNGGEIIVSGCALGQSSDYPEGAVELIIRDTGIGIEPGAQELIFTKFYQTGEAALHSSSKTKFKGGGPGLGLPIARGMVLAHHGKLWVESSGCDEEKCPGSQFYLVLPIRQPAAIQKKFSKQGTG